MSTTCMMEGVVHIPPTNQEAWVFSDYGRFISCNKLIPQNMMYIAPNIVAGAKTNKQFLIVRAPSGTTVKLSNPSPTPGIMALSREVKINVSELEGQVIGTTTDGTPVIMGSPLSNEELKKVNLVKVKNFKLQPSGSVILSKGGGAGVLIIDPGTIMAIVAVVIVVISGVFAAKYLGDSLKSTAASMAEKERYIMQTHIADDAAKSTTIEKEYDSPDGKYHYIKYHSGQIVKIDNETGKVTIEVESGVNWDDVIKQTSCPQGTVWDEKAKKCVAISTESEEIWKTAIKYGAILGLIAIVLYAGFKWGVPAIKEIKKR